MTDSLSDARAFQQRVDGFDEWLREGGHADVAHLLRDLLAEHARLRAERDTFHMDSQIARDELEAAEDARDEAQHRLDLFKNQLSVQEERTDSWHQAYNAIRAQLEELKDCVRDWIDEGLIVPDAKLEALVVSTSLAAPETT